MTRVPPRQRYVAPVQRPKDTMARRMPHVVYAHLSLHAQSSWLLHRRWSVSRLQPCLPSRARSAPSAHCLRRAPTPRARAGGSPPARCARALRMEATEPRAARRAARAPRAARTPCRGADTPGLRGRRLPRGDDARADALRAQRDADAAGARTAEVARRSMSLSMGREEQRMGASRSPEAHLPSAVGRRSESRSCFFSRIRFGAACRWDRSSSKSMQGGPICPAQDVAPEGTTISDSSTFQQIRHFSSKIRGNLRSSRRH